MPSEVLNLVVSVVSRMAFEFATAIRGKAPILLICDEAHRYAPEDDQPGFEATKQKLTRIAREGRKYGLSLGVVSQRPAELASGMLSQCNTIFALRLTHEEDQGVVRRAMSESAFGLIDALPSLGDTEAIMVGEAIAVPMRIIFDRLASTHRPHSASGAFSTVWNEDIAETDDFVQEAVGRWRRHR